MAYHKVELFVCTDRLMLMYKDYCYLFEMCVETDLSPGLALKSACVGKNA